MKRSQLDNEYITPRFFPLHLSTTFIKYLKLLHIFIMMMNGWYAISAFPPEFSFLENGDIILFLILLFNHQDYYLWNIITLLQLLWTGQTKAGKTKIQGMKREVGEARRNLNVVRLNVKNSITHILLSITIVRKHTMENSQ